MTPAERRQLFLARLAEIIDGQDDRAVPKRTEVAQAAPADPPVKKRAVRARK